MTSIFRRICLLSALSFLGWSPLFSQESSTVRHLGVGLNYGGAQVDLRTSAKWMFEVRAQQGKDTTTLETKSSVAGMRIYRFFRSAKSPSPYIGMEDAYVQAKQDLTDYRASGPSLGGFIGLSFQLTSHFALNVDAGPYFISLREKNTKASQSGVDFVGDTSLAFFF